MRKKIIVFWMLLLLFPLASIAAPLLTDNILEENFFKEGYYYRENNGIYIDTINRDNVLVNGQNVSFRWGYDTEIVYSNRIGTREEPNNLIVPFWFEHSFPYTIDLCKEQLSFKSTLPLNIELLWDYDVLIPYYLAFFPEIIIGGYDTQLKSKWRNIESLDSCPLKSNQRYYLRHVGNSPANTRVEFDVDAIFNLGFGGFVFTIPEPVWQSTTGEDYNTGVGIDFNWTKVTSDANVMSTGSDRIYVESDQAFYDLNLVLYLTFNDTNASGTGILSDTNNGNSGQMLDGMDINAFGLWDTNSGFFDGKDDEIVLISPISGFDFGDGNFSFSFWIKPHSFSNEGGNNPVLFDFSEAPANIQFKLTKQIAGVDKSAFTTTFRDSDNQVEFIASDTNAISLNKWYHVAMVIDRGSNQGRMYINGILQADVEGLAFSGNFDFETGTTKSNIGGQGLDRYFAGELEDFKIYNRGLTAGEIELDYNAWMSGKYYSSIKDGGGTSNWDDMKWNEDSDQNNSLTVDYRGCSTADCSVAGDWLGGLSGGNILHSSIYADGNQYFQYRINFDTNMHSWNSERIGDADRGMYVRLDSMTINYTVLTSTSITDLNLYAWNHYDKNIDLNINSDVNIVFDFNITGDDLNYDSILIYYHSIEEGDTNSYGFIRSFEQTGWNVEGTDDISWTILLDGGDTNHVRSSSEDDHAFKQSAYNLDPEEFETKDGAYILNSSADWVKVLLTNVPVDLNTFYNFSFSADYTGGVGRILTLTDCNNNSAIPLTDPGCITTMFSSTDPKDADNYYSFKIVSNDQNQLVADNNMNLNPDGNHWLYFNCTNCNPALFWSIDYITENSNVDRTRNWNGTAGIGSLVLVTNSIDAHIHYLRLSKPNFFDWIVQISNNAGDEDTNSAMQRYTILSTNLPPLLGEFTSPQTETYYNGTIDVNVNVSDGFLGVIQDGVVCDINILDVSIVPVGVVAASLTATAKEGGGFQCATTYNTALQADGNYFFTVRARETSTPGLLSDDQNTESPFFIDNTAPALTYIIPPIYAEIDVNSIAFIIQMSDAGIGEGKCFYGIFLNNVLDFNASTDANSTGACIVTYTRPFNRYDAFFLVVNNLEDELGNSRTMAEKSGLIFVTKGIFNPKNISDADFIDLGFYLFYQTFVGIAVFFVPLVGIGVLAFIFFMIFRKH